MQRRLKFLTLFALFVAFLTILTISVEASADSAPLSSYVCDGQTHFGRELELAGAKVTFEDEFFRPSVSPPDGDGPWYAPMHGGFGGAKFLRPDDPASPFIFSSGYLTIRMSKHGDRWTSGIMQTVNARKQGFAQKYGYFEMKAKFPGGAGTWPAFWLKASDETVNPELTRPEIDVVEAYGGRDHKGYHAAVHLWPPKQRKEGDLEKPWGVGCYRRFEPSLFDGQFHTYGAEVTPDFVIFYYDRKELGRVSALPEFRQPLFMLVDLAYNKEHEERFDEASADMVVDYVRVWQRPEWRAAK